MSERRDDKVEAIESDRYKRKTRAIQLGGIGRNGPMATMKVKTPEPSDVGILYEREYLLVDFACTVRFCV